MLNYSLEYSEDEVRDAVLVKDGDSEIGQVSFAFHIHFYSL